MSGLPAEVKRARQDHMDLEKLVKSDHEYSVIELGGEGGSLYACLPPIATKNLDVEKGDDVETFIDLQNNAVVHVFGGD